MEIKNIKQFVINEKGEIREADPRTIPIIANRCKAFMMLLETGKIHKAI